MKITIEQNKFNCICLPMYFEKKKNSFFNNEINENLKKEILEKCNLFNFKAEHEKKLFIEINKKKYLILGIKKNYSNEDLRRIYSNFLNIIKSRNENKIELYIPKQNEQNIKSSIEGISLTNYSFDKYISKKENFQPNINLNIDSKFKKILSKTLTICKNVNETRDFLNENADVMTPKNIEKLSKDFAKKNKLKIKILNEKQIQKEKLNLMNAVAQGSKHPPRLIIIEYNGNDKSKQKTALIGKGVTFDTGGLNLKPTGYMEDMKLDKGGAATTFGIFKTSVDLKIKKNLILVLGCVENAISANAYKPGDVFKSHNKITVEITNTDAEGRLVLADAMSYIQEKDKNINEIIDMATLTGACMVALGLETIGLFSNNEKMSQKILNSGRKTDELIWQLPIFEEHQNALKSKIADTLNCGIGLGKFGGASSAAAFLQKFVKNKVKWSHLDIAGAAWGKTPKYYNPEFATGKGIRLVIDYLENN